MKLGKAIAFSMFGYAAGNAKHLSPNRTVAQLNYRTGDQHSARSVEHQQFTDHHLTPPNNQNVRHGRVALHFTQDS